MIFELSEIEYNSAKKWQKEHVQVCPHMLENSHKPFKGIPTLGEHWWYKFVPTGLGPCIEVGCCFCNASKNITDVESW